MRHGVSSGDCIQCVACCLCEGDVEVKGQFHLFDYMFGGLHFCNGLQKLVKYYAYGDSINLSIVTLLPFRIT